MISSYFRAGLLAALCLASFPAAHAAEVLSEQVPEVIIIPTSEPEFDPDEDPDEADDTER